MIKGRVLIEISVFLGLGFLMNIWFYFFDCGPWINLALSFAWGAFVMPDLFVGIMSWIDRR